MTSLSQMETPQTLKPGTVPAIAEASRRRVPDRLIRLPEVEALTGLRKSSLYAMAKSGSFPRALRISARCVAWSEAQVLAWVQDQIAASQAQR